jgi:hypothetical protein
MRGQQVIPILLAMAVSAGLVVSVAYYQLALSESATPTGKIVDTAERMWLEKSSLENGFREIHYGNGLNFSAVRSSVINVSITYPANDFFAPLANNASNYEKYTRMWLPSTRLYLNYSNSSGSLAFKDLASNSTLNFTNVTSSSQAAISFSSSGATFYNFLINAVASITMPEGPLNASGDIYVTFKTSSGSTVSGWVRRDWTYLVNASYTSNQKEAALLRLDFGAANLRFPTARIETQFNYTISGVPENSSMQLYNYQGSQTAQLSMYNIGLTEPLYPFLPDTKAFGSFTVDSGKLINVIEVTLGGRYYGYFDGDDSNDFLNAGGSDYLLVPEGEWIALGKGVYRVSFPTSSSVALEKAAGAQTRIGDSELVSPLYLTRK